MKFFNIGDSILPKMTREELVDILKTSSKLGPRVLVCDRNLSGQDLSDLEISNVTFRSVCMDRCRFDRTVFTYVRFENADLCKSFFSRSNLDSVVYEDCKMFGAVFKSTRLTNVSFNHTLLRETVFKTVVGGHVRFESSSGAQAVLSTNDDPSTFDFLVIDHSLFPWVICDSIKITQGVIRDSGFRKAVFRSAVLKNCDFTATDCSNTDFSSAEINNTMFQVCNLEGSNFSSASLKNTIFEGSNIHGSKMPETHKHVKGEILRKSITGWKKALHGEIIKLRIPKGAVVFSINNEKCRTNIAKVIDIENAVDGELVISMYDATFVYTKGETIRVDNFDLCYNIECASGIHFFRTREEAVNYMSF